MFLKGFNKINKCFKKIKKTLNLPDSATIEAMPPNTNGLKSEISMKVQDLATFKYSGDCKLAKKLILKIFYQQSYLTF